MSLNHTVLALLRRGLGLDSGAAAVTNGLEKLAGRWTEQELEEFEANTASIDPLDPELWR